MRGSPRDNPAPGPLDGLGLGFTEAMSGFLGVGERDPQAGDARGRSEGTPIRFDVDIRIAGLGHFLRVLDHPAELSGTVTFAPLGEKLPIRDGRFSLFSIDPQTGVRQLVYSFRFTATDGRTYFLTATRTSTTTRTPSIPSRT